MSFVAGFIVTVEGLSLVSLFILAVAIVRLILAQGAHSSLAHILSESEDLH